MLYSFVGTIANIYLALKNWALLTDLLKVKSNMFFPENCHTQKRTYSLNKRSSDVSRGNLNMAMARYRYTSERIAKR